jgi:hypothetical protein
MLIAFLLCSRTIGFTVVFRDTDSGGNAAAWRNLAFTVSDSAATTQPSVLRDTNSSRREKDRRLDCWFAKRE